MTSSRRAFSNTLVAVSVLLGALAPRAQAAGGVARPVPTLGGSVAMKSLAAPAAAGQTLLFLFSVAAIDITYHEIQKRGGAPSLLDAKEIAGMVGTACDALINDGAIWAGLASAGAAHAAINQPIKILGKILEAPEGKAQLRGLLKASVISTTAFLGWELGSQLWTEASLLVEDPKDFERLSSFRSMAGGAIRGFLYSAGTKDANDARIMKQMMGNMLTVLSDKDKRSHWFDRTWRTRVMTGEFATFLSTMIASGAIGTALFPGAGTIAGLMFGIAGAAVAVVIPQSAKDAITVGMKSARQAALWSSLESNASELRKRLAAGTGRTLEQILQLRRELRDSYVTIVFERLHLTLKTARRDGITNDHRLELEASHAMLRELYANELSLLRPHGSANPLVREEIARVGRIDGFAASLQPSLSRLLEPFVKGDTDDAQRELLRMIEVAYLQGFSEDRILSENLIPVRAS